MKNKPRQLRIREMKLILPKHIQKWLSENDSKGKFNVYSCPDGHHTSTVDLETGVTPMFIDCHICGKRADSHMYKVPEALTVDLITHEWYRPKTRKEIKPNELEHVMQGGLLLRSKQSK